MTHTDYKKSQATLHRVSTGAVTYQFVIANQDGWKDWAHCTVNDDTGELHISSGHDNWSHWWNPSQFGSQDEVPSRGPMTLTAFIARTGPCYLLGKLSRGRVFDLNATAKEIRAEVVGRRRQRKIGRSLARCAYEAVDNLNASTQCYDAFHAAVTAAFDIEVAVRLGSELVDSTIDDALGSDLSEFVQECYSVSDCFLRDAVLPALITACKERLT